MKQFKRSVTLTLITSGFRYAVYVAVLLVAVLAINFYAAGSKVVEDIARFTGHLYAKYFVQVIEIDPALEDVDALLTEYSVTYSLPLELVRAVAREENYKDWLNNDARSSKGALGIMQIIPEYHVGQGKTCEGVADNWTELVGKFNRRTNIHCGVKYLRACFERAYANDSLKTPEAKINAAIRMYNNDDAYVKRVVYAALDERLIGRTTNR